MILLLKMAKPLSEPVLDTLVSILKKSPEHWNESIALFALGIGLDSFEASISQVAKLTQFSESHFQEIVNLAREVDQGNLPKVKRQHLISQVLQREWEVGKGKGVSRYSLEAGLNPGGHPWPTKEIGSLPDFVKVDSQKTENVWNETEKDAPYALEKAKTQTLFQSQNDKHVTTIKNLVALHYARSYTVWKNHDQTWNRANIQNEIDDQVSLSKDIPELKKDVKAKIEQLSNSGIVFRFRIVDLFEGAKHAVANAGFRILRPESGSEFLIGDVPVIISVVPGQRDTCPIGNAAEIYLPLGPELAVVIDMTNSQDSYVEINSDDVERYNRWEVEAAIHDIIMRPGSYLERFPEILRPIRI